jgi:hypothetical protein
MAREAKTSTKHFYVVDHLEFFKKMYELNLRGKATPLDDFVETFRVSYKNKYINLLKLTQLLDECPKNEYLKSFKTKKRIQAKSIYGVKL